MRHKSEYSLRGLIAEALKYARMECCDFGCMPGDVLPKTEDEVTDFIRHRTKRYREAYLITNLETALAKIEARDRKPKKDGK